MPILKLLLTGLLLLGPDKNQDWRLRKEEDGITIYTRSVQGSSFDEFKAVVILQEVSLGKVLDILLDVKNYPSLISDCAESQIVFQRDKYYDIHYFIIKAPWPIKDRDAIYESTTTVSNSGKRAHISLAPMGGYLPEKENMVRMYRGTGYWELEEFETGKVRLTYQFHGSPGGIIPAWLSNSVIVSNPFKTLQNLKRIVAGQ
jgi:hypothetical protein